VIRGALQGLQQQLSGMGGGGGGGGVIGGNGGAPVSAAVAQRAAAYAAAVEAAMQGRTPDARSIIVGRTSHGTLVLMAAPSVEFAPFAPLITSTLAAVAAFDDDLLRAHLTDFFPLLVSLISVEHVPAEVLRSLAELLASRVGPVLGVAKAAAAAEMANAAADARARAEHDFAALNQQLQLEQQSEAQQVQQSGPTSNGAVAVA
jgi:hypothetical protein